MALITVLSALSAIPLLAQVTGGSTIPSYTALSIVNGATQTVEALAPNTIATLYGTNLAYSTHAVGTTDIVGGVLPTTLDGVSVWVNHIACSLYLVSPTQINFLVPYDFTQGTVTVVVARQGVAGNGVYVQLNNTSPGLFLWNGNNAVAVHLNGQVISAAAPAAPAEVIVIYATGLGKTVPDTASGQLARIAAPIVAASQLQILLNGLPMPPGSILYAGLSPGFAGLYQINVLLPADLPANPQIQLAIGAQISPASVQLTTKQ